MGRHYSRTGNPVKSVSSASSNGIYYVSGVEAVGAPHPFGSGQVDMLSFGTTYTIPGSVTEIRVSCMGAGGDGGNTDDDVYGGGGGGGFAQGVFSVTPGDAITFSITGGNVSYDSGVLTAGVGETPITVGSYVGGAGGAGGGTASPILTRVGGKGGNGYSNSGKKSSGGGGGNGLCSFIGMNVPPDGGNSNTDDGAGGGGVYGGSYEGVRNFGVSTATAFYNNYTAWSVLDKNYYNSTGVGEPGVGGKTEPNDPGFDGGFAAGGGATDDTSTHSGGDGGVGGGGGSGDSNSYGRNRGGIALILFEY